MVHLLMALCWLMLGGVLLAWQWSEPALASMYIWGTGIPLGWFGMAMALYNLVRWWLGHSSRKAARQGIEESPLRQRRTLDAEHSAPTPNADFDFTRDPPRPQ